MQTENLIFFLECKFSRKKKGIIFKSFIKLQFKYCHLSWMFRSRKSNKKTIRLGERFLKINNDYESTYDGALSHTNCFSIDDQNIYRFATEIYKVVNNLSVGDFKNLFDFKD